MRKPSIIDFELRPPLPNTTFELATDPANFKSLACVIMEI
jgi:hypothetical protein